MDEVEAELPRGGFHAEAHIRHAARDIGRNRGMGEFDLLVAGDRARLDAVLIEQLFEQFARAGIRIAVDEADVGQDQVLERMDAERVAALDHEAHLARDEADHAVNARIEPALRGFGVPCARGATRQMQPGEIAASCASETREFWLLT